MGNTRRQDFEACNEVNGVFGELDHCGKCGK